MKQTFLKLSVMVLTTSTLGAGGYYLWSLNKSVGELKSLPEVVGVKHEPVGEKQDGKHGEVAKGAAEHGGGHGETAKAEGEHGEPAKSEDGHGEAAKAEGGHGETAKAESGHGEAGGERKPASVVSKGMPLFSLEELYVNVNSEKGAHMMGLKLELELFEEQQRNLVKSHQSGVRDRIIELSRGFDYAKLNTLGGKLYFKELIVSHLNEFFGQPLIKNAHISSFYLQ